VPPDKPHAGLYEQLISRDLARLLEAVRDEGLLSELGPIDPADSFEVFARHVYDVLTQLPHFLTCFGRK